MRDLLRLLIRERRCAACHEPFVPEAGEALCGRCRELLRPRTGGYCPLCGELAPWPLLPPAPCGHCLQKPPPWKGFVFYGAHDGLLRRLLIRLKFGHEPGLGRVLGALTLGRVPDGLTADVVVPVPLSGERLRRRGYNQALELAKPIVGGLGGRERRVRLRPELLRRIRPGVPQTGLSRVARRGNLAEAFAAVPEVAGLKVVLVDDVLTTGATLEAASRALLRAGAAEVFAVVCGRTPRRVNL